MPGGLELGAGERPCWPGVFGSFLSFPARAAAPLLPWEPRPRPGQRERAVPSSTLEPARAPPQVQVPRTAGEAICCCEAHPALKGRAVPGMPVQWQGCPYLGLRREGQKDLCWAEGSSPSPPNSVPVPSACWRGLLALTTQHGPGQDIAWGGPWRDSPGRGRRLSCSAPGALGSWDWAQQGQARMWGAFRVPSCPPFLPLGL